MGAFVLNVTMKIQSGKRDAFLAVIRENARSSVQDEAGCQQFDVLVPEDDPDTVYLYEVYDDAAAFEAHRETPHYAKFGENGRPMIEEANPVRCERQE